ncbi:MAG: aspartyl-phosphate phosphatase Spo0E family protein [Halanaerobacter sp.]
MCLLNDDIDTEKEELIAIIQEKDYDFNDPEVLKKSHEIDKLIVEDIKRQLKQ